MKKSAQIVTATMNDATRLYMAYGIPLDQKDMRDAVDVANAINGLDTLRKLVSSKVRRKLD